MSSKHIKLEIRIGEHAFTAEGPEEIVNAQYAQFLRAIEQLAQPKSGAPAQPPRSWKVGIPRGMRPVMDEPGHIYLGFNSPIDTKTLTGIYKCDGSDIAINFLSDTGGQTLILLLYGFRTLRGTLWVPASVLLRAAQDSGLSIDRIDRDLDTHIPKNVETRGERRGKKYALTKEGVEYAEGVLKQWISTK